MGLFGSIGKFFGFGGGSTSPPEAPNTRPNGSDGVIAYGGYVQNGERNPALQGRQKWVTYANATLDPTVAIGMRLTSNLLGGVEMHAEPNERGGKDAQRGADIVTQGLLTAQMPRPWPAVFAKSATDSLYLGYSLDEWTIKQRDDGMFVFASIDNRPQDTVIRWNKPDERMPWLGVEQQTLSGKTYYIPRNRLYHTVDNMLTNSPEGVGLVRVVVDIVRRVTTLLGIEGSGFETDLRGMPIARAPLAKLAETSGKPLGSPGADAYVSEKTSYIRGALENMVRDPTKLQWLMLDSSAYYGADPNVISAIQKWGVELLRGDGKGLVEIDTAIRRLELQIARVLGVEFVFVGGNDSSGAYAMHADKTSLFTSMLQAQAAAAAARAEDLTRPLIALNGLDPETCTPRLIVEPISTDSVDLITRALANIALAGLDPRDEAIPVLRKRMRLPPPPEPSAAVLGALPLPGPGGKPPTATPPDPAKGEVDVPVDDLGPGKKRAA